MNLNIRQERERERRRQQILAATKRVCTSKGFSRTTVKDVANEAELSPGTIYIYFKNKDELYAALSIRVLKHLNIRLRRARERSDLTFDQRLEAVKKALLEVYEIDPPIFLSFSHLQASETLSNITDDLHATIFDLLHQSLETISEIFSDSLEENHPFKKTPEKLALIFWALFSGLVLWEESKRTLDPRKNFLKPTLDMAFEVLGRGLAPQNQPLHPSSPIADAGCR